MSIPSPAFARYRLQWLLLGLGLLLLLLALQHAFRQVTEINKRDTINAATQLSSQHQRMETFLEAMRKGGAPLLSAASMPLLTEAHTVDLDPAPSGQGYSHGWSIYRDPTVQKLPCQPGTWAWGGIYGHQWYVDPATGLTIVIFTNTAVEGCNGVVPKDVFRAVYSDPGH